MTSTGRTRISKNSVGLSARAEASNNPKATTAGNVFTGVFCQTVYQNRLAGIAGNTPATALFFPHNRRITISCGRPPWAFKWKRGAILVSMDCPTCGLTNPPETIRCDCGYDFGASKPPDVPGWQINLAWRQKVAAFWSITWPAWAGSLALVTFLTSGYSVDLLENNFSIIA
ncbi:MAG: hypothetical protein ABI165_12010, partial [Bryobacteraceae bacterium]